MTSTDPKGTGGPGYETSDAQPASILRWGIAFAAFFLGSFFAVDGILELLEANLERTRPAPERFVGKSVPPEPRLQVRPPAHRREVQAEEAHLLGTYGWVDREGGLVRVPIEEAMARIATEGLPTRPKR